MRAGSNRTKRSRATRICSSAIAWRPSKGLISFTCRASDGPKVVETFLERLALFVEMINLHATCASAAPGAVQAAQGPDSLEV